MIDVVVYILAVLFANIYADDFLPLPLFGQVAIGTFFFGITFTARDRIHYRFGRRRVYLAIALAVVVNIVAAIVINIIAGIPLAGSLRILGASFLSILIAETADTEVFHALRQRSWLARVTASNAVSIPIDTVLFTLIAFLGVFPGTILVSIIFGDMLAKFGIGALVALIRRPHRQEAVNQSLADA